MPDPRRNPEQASDLRAALLDQLRYLIDEAEALQAIISMVPEKLQEGRPLPDDRSLKETYGLLASLDAEVHRPAAEQIAAGDEPHIDTPDENVLLQAADWNAQSIEAILEEVRTARTALVEMLDALPPEAWRRAGWFEDERRDVYQLAHYITQHDADTLRTIGYRLHDSHLTSRPQDLPK